MSFDLIFGVVLLAIFGALLLTGVRCAFVILALAGGNLLADNLKSNVFSLTSSSKVSIPGVPLPELTLLLITLLPAVIVSIHFYRSQRGLSLITQLAPALGAVGLLVVLTQPLLERSNLDYTLSNSPLWGLFESYRSYIIIYALVISLVVIMLDGRGHKHKRK